MCGVERNCVSLESATKARAKHALQCSKSRVCERERDCRKSDSQRSCMCCGDRKCVCVKELDSGCGCMYGGERNHVRARKGDCRDSNGMLCSVCCRDRAGTRWRRLLIYYPSLSCRQGTILAPVTAWRRLPGSGGTWPLDILVCSAARWPPRTTSSRANGRTIRVHTQAAETAPPGHGPADHGDHAIRTDHGGHGRSRRSRQVTAVTAGHGRRFRTGSRRTPRTQHSRTILSHDP